MVEGMKYGATTYITLFQFVSNWQEDQENYIYIYTHSVHD